jgi:hypothetical protein
MELTSVLSFAIQPLDEQDETLSIVPVLNGIPLTRMIVDFERSHGFEPAGDYGGLVPTWFNYGPLDVYFLGEANRENFERAGYYLLGCSCGEVGCWPLTARISKTPSQVIWEHFSQPFRQERDYSSFGPFGFDLDQYTRAVAELASKFPASAGR